MTTFRSGFVAVVGRPNVGKSTLVNAFVGQKIAIVSDKPQTTRRHIRGIRTTDDAQIVFTDTPGFHKPRTTLGARMNDLVGEAVHGVDLVLHVVDAASGVGRGDAFVYQRQVKESGAPAFCVVNKIDAATGHDEVPQLVAAAAIGEYAEVVPVSARDGRGVDALLELILAHMPEGPMYFPGDEVTDQPMDVRLAELIREQALAVTREEVPHSIAVVIEETEEREGLTEVHASLIVERDSQKGILIGKGGSTLKTIGTEARQQIELLVGTKVFLDLRVKVMKEWQRDPKMIERLGL